MDLSVSKKIDLPHVAPEGKSPAIDPDDSPDRSLDFEGILNDSLSQRKQTSTDMDDPSKAPMVNSEHVENKEDLEYLNASMSTRTEESIKDSELIDEASPEETNKMVSAIDSENESRAAIAFDALGKLAHSEGLDSQQKSSSSHLQSVGLGRAERSVELQFAQSKAMANGLDAASQTPAVTGALIMQKGTDRNSNAHSGSVQFQKGEGKIDDIAGSKGGGEYPFTKSIEMPEATKTGVVVQNATAFGLNLTSNDVLQMTDESESQSLRGDASFGRVTDARMTSGPVLANDHTTAVARQVAPQISYAVQQTQNGITEVALSPEELGKVRMTMQTHENTITLSVFAERPETGDLMRRHIEILTQELRGIGYDTINLSFSEHGDTDVERDDQSDKSAERENDAEAENSEMPIEVHSLRQDGLDLRL